MFASLSGTNAVQALGDNITNASETAWPLVLGVVLVLGTLGAFMKFGKKAGFRA